MLIGTWRNGARRNGTVLFGQIDLLAQKHRHFSYFVVKQFISQPETKASIAHYTTPFAPHKIV